MKISFYTNLEKDIDQRVTRQLEGFVGSNGHLVVGIDEEADATIVLGGDGTMLAAARRAADRGTPLLGINLGNVGYLTDVEEAQAQDAVGRLLSGDYRVERRMMLEARISGSNASLLALNDITVHRGQNPRLVHCHIDLNGEYMDDFRADGVVIATPTGSTAYSLSAGGPLLKPDAQMIAITPICPHSLSGRPAVVSHQDIITIKLENSPDLMIAYDGEYILKSKQKFIEITVQASEHTANIIRTCNLSFYELFRKKMT